MDNLGDTGVNDDVTVVLATALAGSTDDFGNVYSSGTTFGAELVTPISVSVTEGYQYLTLNTAGITAVNSAVGSGTLTVGLIGDHYDFNNNKPTLGGDETRIKVWFANASSSYRPYLDIAYAAVAAADNATFFGTNF